MRVANGMFRLSIIGVIIATLYVAMSAYSSAFDEHRADHRIWSTLRCGEKFLGTDMSRYTSQHGIIDIGAAGCGYGRFLARFDEIEAALKEPPPKSVASRFYDKISYRWTEVLTIFILINALSLILISSMAVGRWVVSGFRTHTLPTDAEGASKTRAFNNSTDMLS